MGASEGSFAAVLRAGLVQHGATTFEYWARGAPEGAGATSGRARDDIHRRIQTQQDVLTESSNLAGALAARGVEAGAHIVVQLPFCPESAVVTHAIWAVGAVAVPLTPMAGRVELLKVCRAVRPDLVVIPSNWRDIDWSERVEWVRAELGLTFTSLVVGSAGNDEADSFEALVSEQHQFRSSARSSDLPAAIVFSSGSTSMPKGVMHSGSSLLAAARVWNKRLELGPGVLSLNALPPGHIAGLSTLVRSALSGSPAVFLERWDVALAMRAIAERQPVVTSGTPFHLTALLDHAEHDSRSLAHLRTYVAGAAPVPRALCDRAEGAGVTIVRSYGSSEHPVATMGLPSDAYERRAASDGRPMSGSAVRIRRKDGEIAPDGELGEIELRGPQQFFGYLDASLDRAAFTADGWFRTADLGVLREDGDLVVRGRTDDVVIRGGENISLVEVDEILSANPAVTESCVTGVPDERYGTRVAAVVVARAGIAVDLDSLRVWFREQGLTVHKTPEYLVLVDALPTTETGKPDKQAIAVLASAHASANPLP